MKYDKINKILFYNTYKMPYINNILNNNSKFLKKNLTDFIIKTNLTKMSSEEAQQIEESLLLLWIQDIDTTLIETLFARWYLEKIVWNEERIKSLVQIWFGLDFTSILSLCNNSKEEINESINKFQRLSWKLEQIKELWFCFNGESFCNILYISENQIERIIGYKEQFLFLHQFWVNFDLADWEYFNFDEKIVNALFLLWEKLTLAWKIWLQISLKNLCAIKSTRDLEKKLEDTQENVLSKIQAILWMRNKNLDDEFQNSQKIITTDKTLNNISILEEKIPKNEFIFSISEDSNNFNSEYLEYFIDFQSIISKALGNIDLLSSLLKKIWLINIDIKDFLKLSYLFGNKELIESVTTLIENWISIWLNDLKSRWALFEKLDEETIWFILKMRSIHSLDILDDITLIIHVLTNKTDVRYMLENEQKYKKLVWLYQMLFWDEEILFMNWVFNENLLEILDSPNFDELEWIFNGLRLYIGNKPIHDKIFYPKNLSFIMHITSKNPWNLEKFILTYFNYNINIDILINIDAHMTTRKFTTINELLEYVANNGISSDRRHINEFVILCEAFWFEVSEKTKKQTYDFNINFLLSWKSLQNLTSLKEIFEHLEKTWLLQWKITKDNITEIWALMNFDFTNYEWETIEALESIKSGNDIDIYKKIVRALWEYMYDNYLNWPNNFQELVFIFWKVFNSSFLRKLFNQTNRKDLFDYLLLKKVRLQDIERAYNNYDQLFSLDIENPYYKFCLDYAVETDNYDYLAQNIETIKYLNNNGFFHKVISWISTPNIQDIEVWEIKNTIVKYFLYIKSIHWKEKITPEILIKLINNILNFTWWYLTVSMIEWYIRWKSLEELLQESLEAKKEVLSPNPITHLNLATYETIFLAYRPTGFTIDTIRQNIENGNITDMSHHLEGIQYNPDGYPMEFFQRSYSLEWKQDEIVVNSVNNLLQWKNIDWNIFQWFNLKLFFSQATSLFSTSDGVITSNDGILKLISSIYTLNKDSRIQSYVSNFTGSDFSYERLLELREIFAVVTKDSFDQIIWNEISRLSNEEQEKIWENIWKLKDKNVKSKYTEINAKDIWIHEKIKEIFIWRLLWYASQIRKYISTEMKKFKETKGKQTPVKAILSKNIGSFFAKAGAGLCTSENYEMWKEKRHIHLNLIDEQRQEIIGNVMLYFEPGRNYLITRGFNPRTDIESSYDVNHMVDEMIRVVKEIAVQNWYVDENWEALVYIPPHEEFHALSNREKVRKRILYLAEKINFPIHDANFYANILWVKDNWYTNYLYKTLHRI